MDENFIGGCTDLAMVPPDMQHEQHSEDKFRLGKSERESRRGGRPHLPFAGCCKWKQYIAAFGTNTCRFLVHIAGKVALPMINSEQILAVIPNSEAILCHHLKSSEQAYDVPQYITHQKMPLLPQIGR